MHRESTLEGFTKTGGEHVVFCDASDSTANCSLPSAMSCVASVFRFRMPVGSPLTTWLTYDPQLDCRKPNCVCSVFVSPAKKFIMITNVLLHVRLSADPALGTAELQVSCAPQT